MRIGDYDIDGQVLFAPMAGVSDRPCRQISVEYGAALATTEMLISDTRMWGSNKSQTRLNFDNNPGLISVQIAGAEPGAMAQAARELQDRGAHIVDINLGCPAKKVCGAASGSSLLRDLPLVQSMLQAVVDAVSIPVTLKTRTGWDAQTPTAIKLAQMADAIGIQAMVLHGRTRQQHFKGQAEHDTLARVREVTDMPLIANGDINSPAIARNVLHASGADAVMIGRAAQGNPWLIESTDRHLRGLPPRTDIPTHERIAVIEQHLRALHDFYGEFMGVRFARKHLRWYWENADWSVEKLKDFNQIEQAEEQLEWLAA